MFISTMFHLFRFLKPRVSQPEGLIRLLLNVSAREDERDDAALDLAHFDEPEAENALISVILDPRENEDLVDTAGHSLWIIWHRKGKREDSLIAKMPPAAQKFFVRA